MDKTLTTLQELDDTEIATSFNCDIEELHKYMQVRKKDLTVITQNIRSVHKQENIDDLLITLSNLKFDTDILILTECRLNRNKPIPQINNYTSFYSTKHLNQNDGITVFVKSYLKPIVSEIKLEHASCLQLKILNFIILGIYRSPSKTNSEKFTESLRMHLDTIKNHKNVMITGDININLIPKINETTSEQKNRLDYLGMLSTFALLPGHSLPTRDKSCLDNVFLKLSLNRINAKIAVLNTTVTDHNMVLVCLAETKEIKLCRKTKTYVDFDQALICLANKNLPALLYCECPNTLIENLITKISAAIQDNTRTIRLPKSKRTIKPWITSGILRCIKNRNHMQKQLKLNPFDKILQVTYKRYRNYCTNLLKKLKKSYERKLLSDKNPKVLWNNIKTVTNIKQSKTTNQELLDIESTPTKSVNSVNMFFANVGKNLAKEIENQINKTDPTMNSAVLSNAPLNSMTLLDTDPQEVCSILLNLKSNSACGWDNIPTRFLQLAKDLVVPIITYLANLCFSKGVFPNILKKSIIIPIYKSANKDDVNNYRPISILPSISKILEKIINNRLMQYLNKFNILSDSQYGFRQGKSTHDAILNLTSNIIEHIDSKNKCLTVFLDLKKAFDTVSVPTLVQKLENIGIRGKQLELLTDYLSDRTQRVKIGNFMSEDLPILYGVPQGSVLGPTLFLIYINDLCNHKIDNGRIYSYADDTAIVFFGKTWEELHVTAETGLSQVSEWLKLNLLTLNTVKTNYICFSIDKRTQPAPFNLKIHSCNGNSNCTCATIKRVPNTKYLGLVIDQRLTWYLQIEETSKRIRKLNWIFKNLRYVAPHNVLHQVYFALGQSILTYCIPVWGGAAKTKLLELERAQRSLIKIMYNRPYDFPTSELYSSSNLLSVRKLYILNLIIEKHKTVSCDPNSYLKRRLKFNDDTSVKTRFAEQQFTKRSIFLYKKVHKILNIYNAPIFELKDSITEWLTTMSYDEIEKFLQVLG